MCSASTLEFVLQLCFNALASASRAVLHSETAKAAVQSAYDVDVVVKCIQSTFLLMVVFAGIVWCDVAVVSLLMISRFCLCRCLRVSASPSPQTRTSALVLLSVMAAVVPEPVLSRLMPVFQFMGASSLARDDAYTFYAVQRVVESVVPPLRDFGYRVGLSLHDLLQVFVSCVDTMPAHRRQAMFYSLVTSLGAGVFKADAAVVDAAAAAVEGADKTRYLFAQAAYLLAHEVHTTQKLLAGDASTIVTLCR